MAQLYQIPKGTKASPNNSLGIFEYGDFYDQEDLDSFYAAYATYIPKGTGPKVNAYNDASAPVSPAGSGIESMLDFCVAYPLVWPQGTTLFQGDDEHYSASTDKLGFFQNFLNAVDGVSNHACMKQRTQSMLIFGSLTAHTRPTERRGTILRSIPPIRISTDGRDRCNAESSSPPMFFRSPMVGSRWIYPSTTSLDSATSMDHGIECSEGQYTD